MIKRNKYKRAFLSYELILKQLFKKVKNKPFSNFGYLMPAPYVYHFRKKRSL